MKRLIPYLLFAGAIDFLAIVFYVNTLRMPKAAYQMPRILIALVLLLSVLMIVEQFLQMRKPPSADNGNGLPAKISPIRIGGFVSLILAYVLTIVPLGYFITTPAFLIGSLLFLRSTKPHWILAIAVGFTGFVYLLFVLFLHMPVPLGLLGPG
jgi:hypothetical protein